MLNLVQQYFVSERLQVAQNDGLHEESDFGSQVVVSWVTSYDNGDTDPL